MNKKPVLNCLLLGAACMVGSAFAMNDDMKAAVDFLERHPVTVQMSQDEGTSFSH